MNTPNKFGHVTTTGILTPEAKKMMEKQGFQFVASEKTEAGVMIHHFMTPKVISMAKQEILQGGFADLRQVHIERVPLASATTKLKAVDPALYKEAEIFFG